MTDILTIARECGAFQFAPGCPFTISEEELAAYTERIRADIYASILRGLRSETDSLQLRAIIASVEEDAAIREPGRG